MGVNASTTVDKAVSIIENTSKASCVMKQAVNQNISNIALDLSNTNCDNISFTNRTKMVGTCNLDAVAGALATASTKLSSEQTAALGIGVNVNTSVRDRTNIIRNIIEQTCSSEQLASQNISGITVKGSQLSCKQLQFLNEADITTQCVTAAVIKAVNTDAFESASKQTVDFFAGLGKYGLYIVIALAIIFGGRLLLQQRQPSSAPMSFPQAPVASFTSSLTASPQAPFTSSLAPGSSAQRRLLRNGWRK